MAALNEMVNDFIAQKRIAIVGVSRTDDAAPSNNVYRKLIKAGFQVFPVNPNAATFDNATCYPDLKSIPQGVDAVFVGTRPEVTNQIVRECADLGIKRVWMHKSMVPGGSVSDEAVQFCRDHSITVIAGGCPMMFYEPDFGHRCMRWVMNLTGGLPKN